MENSLDPQTAAMVDSTMTNGAPAELPVLSDQAQNLSIMAEPLTDASMLPVLPQTQSISADEIALYDRQIRLWGVKAQELIRNANILLIGMKALGNEIAKNLVLAGIGSLTILDHENVIEEDLGSQFLITEDDVGKNRAEAAAVELRKMNPRVNILVDRESIMTKMQSIMTTMPEYFGAFQIVISTGQPFEMASNINMSCRMCNVKFYAADVHGMYGYVFSDLIVHQFLVDRDIQGNIPTKAGITETSTRMVIGVEAKKENNKMKESVTKQETYCPMLLANSSPLPQEATKSRRTKLRVPPLVSCLRGLFEFQKRTGGRSPGASHEDLVVFTQFTNEKHMELQLPPETLTSTVFRSFLQNVGTEIPPTAAYLGGQVAQDVINVLGQREQPLQNFLLFDGEEFKSPIYSMQPMFDPTLAMPMDDVTSNGVLQQATSNGNGFMTNGVGPDTATNNVHTQPQLQA